MSFIPGEGTRGKRFLNPIPLRSDELQCYSQGKGLGYPGVGRVGLWQKYFSCCHETSLIGKPEKWLGAVMK